VLEPTVVGAARQLLTNFFPQIALLHLVHYLYIHGRRPDLLILIQTNRDRLYKPHDTALQYWRARNVVTGRKHYPLLCRVATETFPKRPPRGAPTNATRIWPNQSVAFPRYSRQRLDGGLTPLPKTRTSNGKRAEVGADSFPQRRRRRANSASHDHHQIPSLRRVRASGRAPSHPRLSSSSRERCVVWPTHIRGGPDRVVTTCCRRSCKAKQATPDHVYLVASLYDSFVAR
jgi:hypothetical protein